MGMIDGHRPGWIDALFIDGGPLTVPADSKLQRYALLDCAFAPACHRSIQQRIDSMHWRSLYADAPGASEEVLAHSPVLLNIDAVDGPVLQRVLRQTDALPMLSFLHSVEPLEALAERLSRWCVVDADGQHFVLRFPDTRRLPDVLKVLSAEQLGQFMGAGTAWHFRARDASWQTFATPDAPLQIQHSVAEAAALTGAQCAALIAASEPDEVAAGLLYLSPTYGERHSPSRLHALCMQGLAAADALRLEAPMQRMNLCELFWQRPELASTPSRDLDSLRGLLA